MDDCTAAMIAEGVDEASEEKQKAAASFGDVKRRLQTTRKHRRIEAEVPESREAILKSAAAHLKVLES